MNHKKNGLTTPLEAILEDRVGRLVIAHCAPEDRFFITELSPATRWTGTGLCEVVKAWLLARMRDGNSHDPPAKP